MGVQLYTRVVNTFVFSMCYIAVLVVVAEKTYYCNGLQRTHSFLCALCYMVCRVGVKKK